MVSNSYSDYFAYAISDYSFYDAVRLYSRQVGLSSLRITDAVEKQGLLFFPVNSLSFQTRDIISYTLPTEKHPAIMTVSFMGLSGAVSPLPGETVENIVFDSLEYSGVTQQYLNFYSHNFIALLAKQHGKYSFFHSLKYQQKKHHHKLYNLATIRSFHEERSEDINLSKLLPFTGILLSRIRSPEVVVTILKNYYDMQDVSIDEWVHEKITIPLSSRTAIGSSNSNLGKTTISGASVNSHTTKFNIIFDNLSLKEYFKFLPNREHHKSLLKIMDILLKKSLAYDILLGISNQELPDFTLTKSSGVQLGWTSVLKNAKKTYLHRTKIKVQS